MTRRDGRNATEPYRVRAGRTWYWVDPTVPAAELEPGDTVVIYPASGDTQVVELQSRGDADPLVFAGTDGERFDVPARDIAALHLAVVDTEQT
jgi:hypothetical protein